MGKQIYRLQLKRDTTANWLLVQASFIPLPGEVIIYTDYKTVDDGNGGTVYVPGLKIGDGNAYLADLPFIDTSEASGSTVTEAEKNFWNNKLNCDIDENTLVFNRL